MNRHHVRWPAFALGAGLILTLAMAWGGAAPPQAIPSAPDAEGPSAITDAQGRFRFDGLRSSSHILRLDPQSLPGFELSPDRSILTLSPGATRSLAVAPGLALRAAYHGDGAVLDGVLFRDHDGDGLQSAGEPGLAGARVIDPDIYQYFVPFNDNNLEQSFGDVLVPTGCLVPPPPDPVSTTIDSTISLTGSSNGTQVFYDHWEDGYDADPIVPGAGSSTVQLTVNAGAVQTWQNNIPTPRTQTPLLFDGRDRITIVGQPVAAVRAAWLTSPGTLLAGAWEMPRVSDWGQNYTVPIGEDLGRGVGTPPFSDFDYVSASIMAAYDATIVRIDANADGVFERIETINAGEVAFVRGSVDPATISIRSGAQVSASLPVQVQLRAGNCRAPYSGRSYTLVPAEKWSNDYWSPISSFFDGANGCNVGYVPAQPNASADVDIYIVNPSATPLAVNYEGAAGAGVITVPPRSTVSYLKQVAPPPPAQLPRSNTQGVHLFANSPFWAVTAVDTTSLGNNGADFDWSYSLIPANQLSAQVVLSWAPGNAAAPPTSQPNGSTVYVQAIANNTIVRADLDGDGMFDAFDINGDGDALDGNAYGYDETSSDIPGITLMRGQMVRISDPNDHDMTGAIIRSQGNAFPLAVVYGEDACRAQRALPFLDLGYTVLPLPIPELSKTSRLLIDADRSGDISPGDTLEYSIQVFNNGFGPIQSPVLLDTLPYTFTDFVVGSITPVVTPPLAPGFTYDNGSGTFTYVPTGPPGTPDPQVRQIRASYPDIPAGGSIVVRLHIILDRQIPPNVFAVVNKAELSSSNAPPVSSTVTSPINQVDLLIHKTDGRTIVEGGNQLTYTLTYTNAGPGIAYNVIMTDTLPPTAQNVSTPTVPGVITPTLDLPNGRIYFQLGTLQPGQVGQTTVTLTLAPNTSAGNVPNDVVITTRSSETNPNNNRSTDIDQILPADLQIHKTDGRSAVAKGEALVYTLTYTNAGPGIARNAIMTDTLPTEALSVTTPAVPGVITPTIDLANNRVILRLGTLRPGQVGRTTVRLTVGPNTPTNVAYVNTIDIDSRTPDPNRGNNRSQDRDRLTSTASVVLAEFGAARQPGGVLVRWRTVAELDNYGFRVYRSRTANRAGAELITPQIIPGQGRGRAGGASYSFLDTNAPDGPLYYWLEDIDLNGTSEFHGPAQPALQGVGTTIFAPMVRR
jgi:uncharacterized repeat protein (TIGR01451 family)